MMNIAFQHGTDNRAVPAPYLLRHIFQHCRLLIRVLAGVGMAAVDHDVLAYASLRQCLLALFNVSLIEIGPLAATAQHHVCVRVTAGRHHRYLTVTVNTQKTMGTGNGLHRIDRHHKTTVCAILETHRGRQAGGHLPMSLGFSGARANRRPGNQILQILRGNWIERFGRGRQTQVCNIQQQLATDAQPLFDLKRVIKVRVVDQPFPSD